MTRKQTATNETDETASPAIPPGVEAQVNVKYTTRVDPNQDGHARERNELDELAELAESGPMPLPLDTPLDELSDFCSLWANYTGYPLTIVRLADPPERKLFGQGYARGCNQTERLGELAFDPANLTSAIQSLNHNSGGVFRLWLNDLNGSPIPDARARIERFAIADPPRLQRETAQPAPAPAPLPAQPASLPVKSDSERQLDSIKDQLFTTALQRALNPPQTATQATPALAQLPPEQQATLFLLGNSEFMPNIFKQMTALAQQTAGVDREPTIKERAIDAATEIIKSNPLIIDRVTNVVDRIIGRIFGPDPRYDIFTPQQQPQIQQQPQQFQQPPQPQAAYTGNPGMPEAPDPNDDPGDDETMDIIDRLLTLVNSEKELTLTDPLFTELQRAYPIKFRMAIRMIIAFPLEDIITWIKETGGPAYIIMLDGPASGPFLRGRLGALQALIIEGNEKAKQNEQAKQQAQSAPAPTPASNAPES